MGNFYIRGNAMDGPLPAMRLESLSGSEGDRVASTNVEAHPLFVILLTP